MKQSSCVGIETWKFLKPLKFFKQFQFFSCEETSTLTTKTTHCPWRHSLFRWCVVRRSVHVEFVSGHEMYGTFSEAVKDLPFLHECVELIILHEMFSQRLLRFHLLWIPHHYIIHIFTRFLNAEIKITKPKHAIEAVRNILLKRERNYETKMCKERFKICLSVETITSHKDATFEVI